MKLITKEIEKKLEKTPIGTTDGMGKDAPVIVKFFDLYGVSKWLIVEAEKQEDGDWLLYGAADIGHGYEWGYTMLSDLKSIRKFGRPVIERELYCPPKTVNEEWKDA